MKTHSKKPKKNRLDPDKILKQIGERLKAQRIKKGYSSYEYFAYDNEIASSQYGRYERGSDLRVSTLLKLLNLLEMDLQEFFEGFD